MILVLNTMKQLIMWELTVSWEENMVESHERKLTKYHELFEQCRMKERQVHCDPIEIGCTGFMIQSLFKVLTKLGFVGRNNMTSIKLITDTAEKTSRWMWIERASRQQSNISTEWTIIISFLSLPEFKSYPDTIVWQAFFVNQHWEQWEVYSVFFSSFF